MYRKMNRVGVCSMVVAMGAVSTPIARSAGDGLSILPVAPTGVPQAWLTKAERTGFQQTSRYAATVAYCRRLAAASDWIHFESFGVSGEGGDLPLLIASSGRSNRRKPRRRTSRSCSFKTASMRVSAAVRMHR